MAAACALLGITNRFPVGGAQAVAAMAYGTEEIPRCDIIVGPANAFVSEAKRQVMGDVAIDSLAGPSEALVVAGEGARPSWLAADLLAQAEHCQRRVGVLETDGGSVRRLARAVAAIAAEVGLRSHALSELLRVREGDVAAPGGAEG